MSTRNVLVTGGSGFLGRHWLHALLTRAPGVRATVVVRGTDVAQARARVQDAIAVVDGDYELRLRGDSFERLDVVLGDIELPGCGLSYSRRSLLAGRVQQVWHLAATTDFRPEQRRRIDLQNIDGTSQALTLAEQVQAKHFFHISTTYVCGRGRGKLDERVQEPAAGFNNDYERSKHASECLVQSRCAASGMQSHILRPSIIVGAKPALAARGANHGLYGFLRGVHALRSALAGHPPLRLVANPGALLNLVSVDEVVADMLMLHHRPDEAGPVRHLVSMTDLRARDVISTVCRAAGIEPFAMSATAFPAASPLEQALQAQVALYAGYLDGERSFERSLPREPSFTSADLWQACRNWVAERDTAHGVSEPGSKTRQNAAVDSAALAYGSRA